MPYRYRRVKLPQGQERATVLRHMIGMSNSYQHPYVLGLAEQVVRRSFNPRDPVSNLRAVFHFLKERQAYTPSAVGTQRIKDLQALQQTGWAGSCGDYSVATAQLGQAAGVPLSHLAVMADPSPNVDVDHVLPFFQLPMPSGPVIIPADVTETQDIGEMPRGMFITEVMTVNGDYLDTQQLQAAEQAERQRRGQEATKYDLPPVAAPNQQTQSSAAFYDKEPGPGIPGRPPAQPPPDPGRPSVVLEPQPVDSTPFDEPRTPIRAGNGEIRVSVPWWLYAVAAYGIYEWSKK